MQCDQAREAVSARLDGEDPGVAGEVLADHLTSCDGCARFEQRAAETMRTMRISAEVSVPDQTGEILAAIGDAPTRERRRLDWVRGILVGLAVVELVHGIRLFAETGVHASRDAAAFSIALAIGLVIAAFRPALAAGVLPIVAVLAAISLVGGVMDVSTGRVAALTEVHHLIELGAAAAMFMLLRPVLPRRTSFRASPTH